VCDSVCGVGYSYIDEHNAVPETGQSQVFLLLNSTKISLTFVGLARLQKISHALPLPHISPTSAYM
jgi:hypothetical protein